MATAAPEVVRPPKEAVMSSVISGVTTPEGDHRQFVSGVVQTLAVQHPVTVEQATPVTPQTPIAQTSELKSVGAKVTDGHEFTLNEEVDSKRRDISHFIKSIMASIFGGHTEKREGPVGKIWNKIKNMKNKKEVSKGVSDQEIE